MELLYTKMIFITLTLSLRFALGNGQTNILPSTTLPKAPTVVAKNSTAMKATSNATVEGSAYYDYDEESCEIFVKNLVNEKMQVEFQRHYSELKNLQQKEILQYEMENGKCKDKDETSRHSYYDPRISDCRQCDITCPSQDYLCIEKCENYRTEWRLNKTIKDWEKQDQSEHTDLKKQITSWRDLCIIIIVVFFVSVCGAAYLFRESKKEIKRLQNKFGEIKASGDRLGEEAPLRHPTQAV